MSGVNADLEAVHEGLPRLGVGISGEYGVRPTIDPSAFGERWPGLVHFVEFGSDADRGLDPSILRWVESGGAAPYHFLDVNFEEPVDLDDRWITETRDLAHRINSPWLCGDSGMWHFGPRDRGHGLLLPPILNAESAQATAHSVRLLQEATGLPVLPENPPSLYYLGDLHILEYFARVSAEAGCGLLLDAAHLAIYQRACGNEPTTALDSYPLDRVVEIHVAGGGEAVTADGYAYIDDDHRAEVHQDTWAILESILHRVPRLKALCYECEHNDPAETVETFQRLNQMFPSHVE